METGIYRKKPSALVVAFEASAGWLVVLPLALSSLGDPEWLYPLLITGAALSGLSIFLVLRLRRSPRPVFLLQNELLLFYLDTYLPRKIAKVPRLEVERVELAGKPRARTFIFVMKSGEEISVNPQLMDRKLEERVVGFLEQQFGEGVWGFGPARRPVTSNGRGFHDY